MNAIKKTTTNILSDEEMEIILELVDGRCVVIWHHDANHLDTVSTYKTAADARRQDWYESCSLPMRAKGEGSIAIKTTESFEINQGEAKVVITLDDDPLVKHCRTIVIRLYAEADDDDDGYITHGEITTYAAGSETGRIWPAEPFDATVMPPPPQETT